MRDWKRDLAGIKRKLDREKDKENTVTLQLPAHFAFKRQGATDFNSYLRFFDWSLRDQPVRIDFSICESANYQALSLLALYIWHLREQGCRVTTLLGDETKGAGLMWHLMGAKGLINIQNDENEQFHSAEYKPLIAVRNTDDFKLAIATAEDYTKGFDVEYTNTLRYVLSELLYNTLEHGVSYSRVTGVTRRMPSLIQFTWYETRKEMQFVIADIGVGIKQHLSQAYAGIDTDEEAIRMAVRPQVSGTFGRSNPYVAKNNAGVGLFLSTNIVRRLNADMHIVSGSGVMHISPRDITTKTLRNRWPGTLVVVSIKVEKSPTFALHTLMHEFREAARMELARGDSNDESSRYYLGVVNIFGPYAEDKQSAIKQRDSKVIPALNEGKSLMVDFADVVSAPHSFLSALLATPIKILGMAAYKKIKIVNASPEIRETIDYILDENTESN